MNKASCTLPSQAHAPLSRFLKIAPLAALLAAPAVWAVPTGGILNLCPACYVGEKGATGNTVTVDNSAYNQAYGAWSDTKEVKENFLTIESSGKVVSAIGGHAASGQPATNNTLTIYGEVRNDNPFRNAFGGVSNTGSATHNTIAIYGTVKGLAYGGFVASNNNATDNTVVLAGGTVTGSIYGGFCQTCDTNNCNVVSRNTLKVQGKGSNVSGEVGNFARIAFTLPDGFTAGSDTMLDITGANPVNLDGVEIAFEGNIPAQQHGSTLTLINKAKGTPKNTVITVPGYKFDLSIDSSNALVATVTVLHPITYKSNGNGTLEDCTPTEVGDGDTVTITCKDKPAGGHKLDGLSITDKSGTTPCDKDTVTCKATGVTGPLTVTASFAALGTYSITPTPVGEGTINCDADKVTEDDSVVFKCTAAPKDGHELVGDLTLTGGNSTDTCTQKTQDKWECSATNVTSPLVVTAFFEPKTYKVQPAGTIANGSLENCTPTTVKHGENASVTCDAVPNPGFEFTSLTLSDGTSSETCKAKTCSLPNAAGDVEITASFTKVHHAITYAITGNGSISCTPNPVPDGEKVTCTATPADGYKLELSDLSLPDTVGWKCDLAAMTCSTTSGVTSPLSVGATFTARNSGGNGGSTGGGGGSAPTMSELGLLLSGLALAGSAAPALRRREKQGKKADTSK